MSNKIAVIGGGAAGLLCSIVCAENGGNVTLFEKNKSQKILSTEKYFDNAYLGKKLLITGKGRCNVTNACSESEFMSNIPENAKFMFAAYNAFDSKSTMEFFKQSGVELKVERGNRVFPVSDKSSDILNALKNRMKTAKVSVLNRKVISVAKTDNSFNVSDESGVIHSFDKVVICTGGVSYPQTGSDGDGYEFAKKLGHTVKEPKPSLVPLECYEKEMCSKMAGLSLKNVKLSLVDKEKKKVVYSDTGEMLFTHFGISGPLVLSASAHMKKFNPEKYRVDIDLKIALDIQTLDSKLVKSFEKEPNKNISNILSEMLPKSMVEPFCRYSGFAPEEKANGITKEKRRVLAENFKKFSLDISSFRPISEAIITSGGINVKEINPSTMESKLVNGLYFAGEVIDVDAYTGGFNLQIAFSTAYLAGINLTK